MKTCAKCKAEKPLTEFRKHARNKDGYQYYCKQCQNSMNSTSAKNKRKMVKLRETTLQMKVYSPTHFKPVSRPWRRSVEGVDQNPSYDTAWTSHDLLN